eukprot:2824220-Prymnesium_polylepis.1
MHTTSPTGGTVVDRMTAGGADGAAAVRSGIWSSVSATTHAASSILQWAHDGLQPAIGGAVREGLQQAGDVPTVAQSQP